MQLLSPAMDMDQFLSGLGRLEQGIATGGHFTQARTQGNDEVTAFNATRQCRVDANAHVPGVQRVVVVKRILETKSIAHRQLPRIGKTL